MTLSETITNETAIINNRLMELKDLLNDFVKKTWR